MFSTLPRAGFPLFTNHPFDPLLTQNSIGAPTSPVLKWSPPRAYELVKHPTPNSCGHRAFQQSSQAFHPRYNLLHSFLPCSPWPRTHTRTGNCCRCLSCDQSPDPSQRAQRVTNRPSAQGEGLLLHAKPRPGQQAVGKTSTNHSNSEGRISEHPHVSPF